MYREMRRKDRKISDEQALDILNIQEYGTLSTVDANSQPYLTPLSYILYDNAIYFHSALVGQKIDNINYNPKVCFNVVGKTKPVYDNDFTTYFESVIVYGNASKVEEDELKIKILMLLCEKYLPEHMDKAQMDISKSLKATAIYKISIEHLSGKAKIAKE